MKVTAGKLLLMAAVGGYASLGCGSAFAGGNYIPSPYTVPPGQGTWGKIENLPSGYQNSNYLPADNRNSAGAWEQQAGNRTGAVRGQAPAENPPVGDGQQNPSQAPNSPVTVTAAPNAEPTFRGALPVASPEARFTAPATAVTDGRFANYGSSNVQPNALSISSSSEVAPAPTQYTVKPVPEAVMRQVNTPATPTVLMVNSKRISLNYQLKDVGPSGISQIELWYTRDGQNWQKYEAATQTRPPFIVDVNEEGLYGFTLVARSGVGLSKRSPQAGEAPQVWAEVDLTKPVVHLSGIEAGIGPEVRNLTINWTATDKNLGQRPISIAYAEQPEGPWQPIAINVDNNGHYVWPMPSTMPQRFLVKVEAVDLVGNVGIAQTPNQILVDLSLPTVSILSVVPAAN